jgi:hypothetical protein
MGVDDFNTEVVDKIYDYLGEYNTVSDESEGVETKEDASKCYVLDEVDDFTVESIKTGEVCTIETAKAYGIFGKDKYFNSMMPDDEKDNLDILIGNNENNSNYSLCTLDNENAYMNCVLSTKNPWKTLNDTAEYCMIPIDITLPSALSYNKESPSLIDKPSDISITMPKSEICKERWYDWFSIPDYHLSNKYVQHTNSDNETVCLAPCKSDSTVQTLPYTNPNGDRMCIDRNLFRNGYYKEDFHYLPLALVFLLGSGKETLIQSHQKLLSQTRSSLSEKDNMTMDYDIYNDIMKNEKTQDAIYEDIRKDLKPYIINLLNLPVDETNILVPSSVIQSVSQEIMTKERILAAYEISERFYFLSTLSDYEEQFKEWKQELADVSGLNVTDPKFYKQLLMLKKASNILFDNKSIYSKNKVFYIINTELKENERVKKPINFVLSNEEIKKSLTSNPSETNVNRFDLMSQDVVEAETLQKSREDESTLLSAKSESGVALSSVKRSLAQDEKVDNTIATTNGSAEKSQSFLSIVITLFIIISVIIFLLGLIIIIFRFARPYLAKMANTIVLSFGYYMFYLQDLLMKGRYSPWTKDIRILKVQDRFIDKQISKDQARLEKA